MSTSQQRFLTDNPFRALSVGSAETIATLRRKADSAEKAAKVGLAPDVPLTDLLGDASLSDLPRILRSLATDGVRRTGYRIMWPLSTNSIPLLLDGGKLRRGQLPEEELEQLLFLFSWLSYLESGSPLDSASTLEGWGKLCASESMTERLMALQIQEGEVDRGSIYEGVLQAQRTVIQGLLSRIVSDATDALEAGQTAKAAQLIESVLNSRIDEGLKQEAFAPIADTAHRLNEQVEIIIEEMVEWRRGFATDPPAEVIKLERISSLMMGHLPSARDWEATAHGWTTALVWKMREESSRLHDENDNLGALAVTRIAVKFANTKQQKARIGKDLEDLEKIVADEKTDAAYAGIKKISKAPTLQTLNGIGLKVYGRELFPADHRFYFTILYFTVLLIPIFPIRRYLVKDAVEGGWHFVGKTSWTPGMKMHLGVFSLLSVIFWVYVASTGQSDSYSSSASTSTTGSKSDVPSPTSSSSPSVQVKSTNPVAASASDEQFHREASKWIDEQEANKVKRDRLENELESLKPKIAAIRSEINNKAVAIDELRSTLSRFKLEIDTSEINQSSNEEVDAYNAKVRRYELMRAGFNDLVVQYNRKVKEEKKRVRRHNQIVEALNSSK